MRDPVADRRSPSCRRIPAAIAARALPALLYGADHPYGNAPRGRRSGGGRRASPATIWSASTGSLDPARQCEDLRRVATCRWPSCCRMLEARFGNVGGAGGAARASRQFGADPGAPGEPRIVLIDRPRIAAVGDPRRADHRRSIRRSDMLAGQQPPTTCSAATSSSRINMDLREAKGWSYGVSGSSAAARARGALHHQRAGPGRPHRRFDRRARSQQVARLPRRQGRHRRANCARVIAEQHQRSCRASSKPRAAVLGAMMSQRAATAGPTIITRRSRDRYRGHDPGSGSTRRSAPAIDPNAASSGWWSATPPRSGRSSPSSACRSR